MVTIDNKVENVKGEFDGDLTRSHLDYERATQGLEKAGARMSVLEESIKQETEYSNFNLPKQAMQTDIEVGDVHFTVTSETRTKRPAYKKVVEEMEQYIRGISWRQVQGKEMSDTTQIGRNLFIDVDSILETYEILVAGIMKPEIKHTIKYKAEGRLKSEEVPNSMTIGKDEELTDRTAREYVRLDKMSKGLKKFAKAYETGLKEGQTKVTQKKSYSKESSKAEGPDWAYVVMSLVTVPTNPDKEGELNYLADPAMPKAEKEREMPHYKLVYQEVNGERKTYVSLQSLYNRMQDLKQDKAITADKTKVNGTEIV